jgi:hypothetical protein
VTRKQIMDLADRRMLNHRCGRCMADVGAWCKTARGSRASMLHSARFYAAQAAGHLPLTGGDIDSLERLYRLSS